MSGKSDDCPHTKIPHLEECFILGQTNHEKCYFIAPMALTGLFVCTMKSKYSISVYLYYEILVLG